jgi:putative methionine-R-sulfoxide reductase with GAF domain
MDAGVAKPAIFEGSQADQDRKALLLLLEYVRAETRADGCAAALNDGTAVVAQASTGLSPQAGAILSPDSGLSGECLRTGNVVQCANTASDPRTDAEACRRMRIGSVLVVPILADGKVVGVLEVFSSQPDNFMEPDTGTLQRVADVIGAMIYRPK